MNNIVNVSYKKLAFCPYFKNRICPVMFVNGFKFHTEEYGKKKTTVNSGVCVKGGNDDDNIKDYYGVLEEIIELTYSVVPDLKTFLFRCRWFDCRPNIGVRRVHKDYPLIEVNHKKRYLGYDPFVLATQATQVYYTSYPAIDNSRSDWWAIVKTKPRWSFHSNSITTDNQAYQHDLEPNELLQVVQQTEDIGPLINEVDDGVEVDDDNEEQVEAYEDEFDFDDDNKNNESDDDNED